MTRQIAESIMSKGRELLSNGNVKTVFQFGAIIFAAGILWAKVAGLEAQVEALRQDVAMIMRHLLGGP